MAHQDTIRLRPATPADAEALARICMDALAPNPISRGLHGPSGTSLSAHNSMLRNIQDGLNPATSDAQVSYVVAEMLPGISSENNAAMTTTVASSGTAIGFAKWHFYDVSSSAGEAKSAAANTAANSNDGASGKLAAAFFEAAHHLRQSHIQGRPCAMVTLLAVDPKQHARGAGSALVRWGTERADRANLDCWIFCTPVAHPMYYKCGFRNVDVLDVNVGEITGVERSGPEDLWGQDLAHDIREAPAPGYYRAVLMRRRARQDSYADA